MKFKDLKEGKKYRNCKETRDIYSIKEGLLFFENNKCFSSCEMLDVSKMEFEEVKEKKIIDWFRVYAKGKSYYPQSYIELYNGERDFLEKTNMKKESFDWIKLELVHTEEVEE